MITPITKRDPRKLYLERLVFMAALLIPAVFRGRLQTADSVRGVRYLLHVHRLGLLQAAPHKIRH